jgi:TonB family protein
MSKIRSSWLANTKLIVGIAMVAILVAVFACEQKESIKPAVQSISPVLKTTLENGKLKIEGDRNELAKVKELFTKEENFEVIENDSLGYVLVIKIETRELPVDEEIFFMVDQMPEFQGGDQALRKFIANSVKYPKKAQENGVQGKVYVSFVVSKEGKVANAKITRSVNPLLDKEALRVVNQMPTWKPGYQKGKPVNVSFTVPINFVLQ